MPTYSRSRRSRSLGRRAELRQANRQMIHNVCGGDTDVAFLVRSLSRNLSTATNTVAVAAGTGDVTLIHGGGTDTIDVSASSLTDIGAASDGLCAYINDGSNYTGSTQMFEAMVLDGLDDSVWGASTSTGVTETNPPMDLELLSSSSKDVQGVSDESNYGMEVKWDFSTKDTGFYLCSPYRNFSRFDGHNHQVEIISVTWALPSAAALGNNARVAIYEVNQPYNVSQRTLYSRDISGTGPTTTIDLALNTAGIVTRPGYDALVEVYFGDTFTESDDEWYEVEWTWW